MVAAPLHRRRRPRVRGADPPARRPAPRRRARGCSTSGAAKGSCRGASPQLGAGGDRARPDRRPARRPRRRAAAACATCAAAPSRLPFAARILRRRRDLPHAGAPRSVRARDRRGGPGARPDGRFVLFLNHPLLQAPGQRVGRRPHPRGAVLAGRPVPPGRRGDGGGGTRASICRSCTGRCTDTSTRWPSCGLLVDHMDEPAPPPGFLAQAAEYAAAATIPRLLVLRAGKAL